MAALPAHVADIHPCVKALEIHREHDGFDVLLEESHPVASNGRAAASESAKRCSRQRFTRIVWLLPQVAAVRNPCLPTLSQHFPLRRGVQRLVRLLRHFPKTYRAKSWMVYARRFASRFQTAAFPKRGSAVPQLWHLGHCGVQRFSLYEPRRSASSRFPSRYGTPRSRKRNPCAYQAPSGPASAHVVPRFVLPELGAALLAASGIRPDESLQQELCCRIARIMKAFP